MSSIDRINGLVGSIAVKAPVRIATTTAITLSGLQTIDGVTLAEGDSNLRVLVRAQTDSTENGIYDAKLGAWTRAADFDGSRDAVKGTQVVVQSGTLYANYVFTVTTSDPVVFGTSSITFATSASAAASAAAASADAAIASAAAVSTAADVALTHADVVLTHADVVLTHADVVLTHADVVTVSAMVGLAGSAAIYNLGRRTTGTASIDNGRRV